jgi:mono/diheme cytochrome c family protein
MAPILAAVLLVALALSCRDQPLPAPPQDLLSSEEAMRAGEELYRRNCSLCHGPSGHGDGPQAKTLYPPPADLANLRGERADRSYWFYRIKEGGKAGSLARDRSAMPGFGEHLSDEQIWELVAYLNALAEGRR